MDATISKWLLEFLLRQSLDEPLLNRFFKSLPPLGDDPWLKKIILLRKIEFELANCEISETILDLLELVEELDHKEGRACPDSMKSAYSAVAVDCTVRFLDEENVNNGKYVAAVQRVWRDRVCKVKSLGSEESRRKMEEIEAALWDSQACAKLLELNTRVLALKYVRVYVKEQWEALGPTFLELVASKAGKKLEEMRDAGDYGETQKGQTPVKRKHIKVKRKCGNGAKLSHVDKETEMITVKTVKTPAPEVDKVPTLIESSPMETEQQTSKKVDVPNAQTAQTDLVTGETVKTPTPEVVPTVMEYNPKEMKQKTSEKVDLPNAQRAQTLQEVLENIDTETHIENQPGPKMDASIEVERVQEALKLRDPLPDALETETGAEIHASPRADIGEIQNHQAQYRPNYITVGGKHGQGAKTLVVDVEDDVLLQETVKIPPSEVDRVPASIASNSKDLPPSEKVDLPNATAAETRPDVLGSPVVENQLSPKMHSTPELERAQDSLKSSSMELRASVGDALQTDASTGTYPNNDKEHGGKTNMESDGKDGAQTNGTSGSTDNRSNEQLGTCTDSNKGKIAGERQSPTHADNDIEHADMTNMVSDVRGPVRTAGTLGSTDNGSNEHRGTFTDSSKEKIAGKRPIPTQDHDPEGSVAQHGQPGEPDARSMERGDSTDKLPRAPSPSSSPPSKRPCLPSPKVNKPPCPLKKYDSSNVFRKRRQTKLWVSEEEDALREGVAKLGRGRWKEILLAYRDVFEKNNRTDVDLKDKWRTLTKKR